jgi:adenosylmethionine---8-amino-7-oxononanoate aminotransferase
MHPLAKLDHKYLWHPFTQMQDWLKREPIVIVKGKGAVLQDAQGKEYLDANSSIWTNLHGHQHPRINRAVHRQLGKIAHSSALGFANEPASLLAEKLVRAANPPPHHLRVAMDATKDRATRKSEIGNPKLEKVFFSDDGSTALEVALKLSYEFTRRTRGSRTQPRFVSLDGAYHGDTVGAVSIGHIDQFHKAYSGLLFKTDKIKSPYCYRCPFNRAKPERADARKYRKCNWECVDGAEKTFRIQKRKGEPYAAFIFEPLMQGAAGMIAQPSGWLERTTEIARAHGALLIADEVMTGFGRTGVSCRVTRDTLENSLQRPASAALFACTRADIQPDFLCVAKGLTGGYLPMAATLTTEKIFDAFLGEYEECKAFFHGHSYTGNQLGAAASLASLELLQTSASLKARGQLQKKLQEELQDLWSLPNVGDIRQVGLIAGVELVRDWKTREPFRVQEQAGIRVCNAMARRGVLTRPVGNVIVLMPPYCTAAKQVRRMVFSLREAIQEVFTQARS